MSVEDIQYLYENSEKDNFILYVDSSLRNQNFHPKPSEYTITFEQPFKFVYGIDILDASIPATMYNIEETDNDCHLFTYLLNPTSSNLGTDSYSLQSLLYEMEEIPEFDRLLNSKQIAKILQGGADSRKTGEIFITNDDLLSTYPRYTGNNNQFRGLTNNPFYYVMKRTSVVNLEMYPTNTQKNFTNPTYAFSYKNQDYFIEIVPGDQYVSAFIANFENADLRFVLTQKSTNIFDAIFYRVQGITEEELGIMRSDASIPVYMLNIQFMYVTLTPGNYGATSFMEEAKKGFGGSGVEPAGQSSGDISIRPRMTLTSEQEFVVNMQISTCRTSMGFDEFAVTTIPSAYKQVFYKDNKRLFASIRFGLDKYRVVAPGVLYLLGTRYVILRCPEIEGHMYASRAFGQFSPGIGMFKMYAVNDIAHQRFDFVNFHKKPFHPIGKLDRMTLRFERPDGKIYDFKGANHLLLICLKYFVPSQKKKFQRSILNPNYDYDFNKYLHRKIEYKEQSDDEEEQIVEITNKYNSSAFRSKYTQIEQKYDFSSSEDEDDDFFEKNHAITNKSWGDGKNKKYDEDSEEEVA